jgi:hypothetical protein
MLKAFFFFALFVLHGEWKVVAVLRTVILLAKVPFL